MTPADLQRLATARFGPHNWMTSLAAALAISENTVRRWARGDNRITPEKARHIRLICDPTQDRRSSQVP